MRFDDFDTRMRLYEQSLDQYILPDMYIVARLDGHGFTKFTNHKNFQKPFDEDFRDIMVETTKRIMEESGFHIIYGYTQSDEISLLFHPQENTFGRKTRKINSVLAAEASAIFSLLVGEKAVFDCRVVPLPNLQSVYDYFSWRQEDAHRNSLNSWCYWTLRKEGESKGKATSILKGKGVSFKNELLFQYGINYNTLPNWQKRGVGIYYKEIIKTGYNPIKKENVEVKRKKIHIDYELPFGEKYRHETIIPILRNSMES